MLEIIMNHISKSPGKNHPKLLGITESISWRKEQLDVFHKVLDDSEKLFLCRIAFKFNAVARLFEDFLLNDNPKPLPSLPCYLRPV